MDDNPIELASIAPRENENQNTERMKEEHEIMLDERIEDRKDTPASSSQLPKIKKIKKKEDKGKKFFKKKELAGLAVRGEHLLRLVRTTKLNRQQVLNISKKFGEFSPTGHMTLDEFKKALEFEKEDKFAARLFTLFSPNKNTDGELSMDDFIMGVAKVAPEADINVKLDLFYELFDVDSNGTVVLSEFKEMTKYSMRHGRFGIDEDKLNSLINSVWKQLDVSGDNQVTRDEFKEVLLLQKTYVNSLTLQVSWLQAAFHSQGKAKEREYLDNEPLEELVFDVAQQFQAPQEQISKWVETLKSNLYSDVKSLLEISSQDWTSMELPRRLYYAIKETIDPTHQTKEDLLEGRVKHSIAASGHRRVRNYIVSNKVLIIFTTLYLLGNAAMLAWTLVKYLTPNVGQKYYDQAQLIGPSFVISRCGGALAKYNFAILLFPVCYRTMTWLRASTLEIVLPIDYAMKFHRRIGAFILFCGLMHMCAHCVNFLRLSKADVAGINNAFKWSLTAAPTQAFLHSTRTGITGWIMVGCMIILVSCALERVRRSNFRLFFSVHHLYLPIIVCLVIHDGLINHVEIIYWMIPAISLFLIERSITIWRGAPKYEALEGTRILKGDVLALQIKKPAWFKYSAGHYLWINCPSVSITEWHPFTLTSSPDEDFLMVDINCIGDWTKKLKEMFATHLESPDKPSKDKEKGKSHSQLKLAEANSEIIEVKSSDNSLLKKDHHHKNAEVMVAMAGQYLPAFRIDGPYGTASSDVLLYTHAVLIGGGIGVTPFISILKSIRYAVLYTNGCPLHAVHFIWVTRNQENFQWFSMMLAELQRHEDLRGFLRVSIYLTGPRHPINDIRLLGVSLLMNKAKEKFNEDLVTGLEGQTHFGRPDFSKILLQLNHEWAGNDVGVFFCGPEPLAQAVRITCRAVNHANRVQKQSKKGTKAKGANFEFHQEHF